VLDLSRPVTKGTWSEPALRVLRERYLRREGDRVVETPEDMCWRVARCIAQAEERWGKSPVEVHELACRFYEFMVDGTFLPNSPTLMNAGKNNGLQYSACYVLPVPDSLEGIFEAVKRAAIIHKSGGGTGFAFSRLRPKDAIVASTGGKASGPVSFLRVFNAATEAVKQGGTRRGANMGILRVDHPDILEFIECKLDGSITNFNISVAITDAFMEAYRNDAEYDLVAPHTKQVTGRLRAREVFNRLVQAAWRTGDPGVVFIDRINKSPANPVQDLPEWEIEATNPCGEQPLAPNEACNLGSLALQKFVRRDVPETAPPAQRIDWAALERAVRLAVRFLDDVIEVNPYPLPEIDAAVKANRRIGLGVMGWADLLLELGIPYDSEEALSLAEEIMLFINRTGHDESARLAEERGPFPNWPYSIYKHDRPLRNATVTTIAPTGTISIIANCSSGIEPLFALAYSHIVGERHLRFVNPIFERWVKEHYPEDEAEELLEAVAKAGVLSHLPPEIAAKIPERVRRIFVTAHEIHPDWHVRMQAAFQKGTDNAVSKTINLPHEATVEDVARAYLLAYETGCRGITVFRDGCKGVQVLHVGTAADKSKGAPESEQVKQAAAAESSSGPHAEQGQKGEASAAMKPRPRVVEGVTYRAETPLGTAFVTVNKNGNGQPFEVFLNVGKAGSDIAAVAEAIGRLISLTLRLPSPLSQSERLRIIVEQLSGIGGGRQIGFGPKRVRSLPDAIAQVLGEHLGMYQSDDAAAAAGIRAEAKAESAAPTAVRVNGFAAGEPLKIGDLCPGCGCATLVHEEGCRKCHGCGYSEC